MPPKIVFLNGSPKSDSNSCSHKMIQYFSKALAGHFDSCIEAQALKLCLKREKLESHFTEVLNADILFIVAPLYVDSLPSSVLDYLRSFECFIKENPNLLTHPLKVYGFINCGFLGGSQNTIALEILENFALRCNFIWCGGLGVGSGAMLASTLDSVPRESKMQQPIYVGLDHLVDALKNGCSINSPNKQLLVTQNFSPNLFIFSLNIGWLASSGWKCRKIYAKPYLKS